MLVFKRPDRAVDRVFIHCSASDNPEHDDVAIIRHWHVDQNGWSDVGYHYYIQKSGNIQLGRGVERTPAAQSGNNTGTIAICLGGLAADRFTLAQFGALCYLCSSINDAYEGGVTFHGHREVAQKDCPVFNYKALLHLDDSGNLWSKASAESV